MEIRKFKHKITGYELLLPDNYLNKKKIKMCETSDEWVELFEFS